MVQTEIQNNEKKFISRITENKNLVVLVVTIFLSVIIGMLTQVVVDKYLPEKISNYKQGFSIGHSSGFDEAKKLVENSKSGALFKVIEDVRYISGTITNISNEQIMIHTDSLNPFEKSIEDRILIITKDSKIIKQEAKDPNLLSKEKEDFAERLRVATSSDVWRSSPSAFVDSVINISDLRVGDIVSVSADENIKNLTKFTPISIIIKPNIFTK